jgi:hypothetical protein
MKKLMREDLMGLEQYSDERDDFRARVIKHKKNRIISLGPNMSLHFEDRLIMQYQVQEMLRAEKIFDAAGIQEELETYNALIPDGSNWKATLMIEYSDPDERAVALKQLLDVENCIWMQVEGHDKVFPVVDEDLERATEEKTSSVHFLRFELTKPMIQAAKAGAAINLGVDHPAYTHSLSPLADNYRDSLVSDLS